jgi:hypothetical protein
VLRCRSAPAGKHGRYAKEGLIKVTAQSEEEILHKITEFFLDSRDFNGIPIWTLSADMGSDWKDIREELRPLVEKDMIGLIDEETDVNPHIIRRGFEPIEVQLRKLDKEEHTHMCAYPRTSVLREVVDRPKFDGIPYGLELALGEPQLSYKSFNLSVLEFYRNDPRYRYETDDINGRIYYDSDDLEVKDKAFLETFGFSYDTSFNRAVAVFIRYLYNLTPEHQQIWKNKEITGDFKLHPDYYRNTIIGDWGERVPICSAFLKELYIINRMVEAIGRPPLFRDDFGEYGDRRPKRFGFLIRPTLEEFNSFVLLFDKMVSDNINKDFFMNEVPYEAELERKDGKIQVVQKGTLQILDDWMRKKWETTDWAPWVGSMSAFKRLRKLRQKPAHSVKEDVFDQEYFKRQRQLIIDVYTGVRNIRLMLTNHPLVKAAGIEIPDLLFKGMIWNM